MDLPFLQEITKNYTKELEDSYSGHPTSLFFIKISIPSSPLVKDQEAIQTMTLGGTMFRNSLVTKNSEGLSIEQIEESEIPNFATKEIFLSFIESKLRPHITILAINFANPLEPIFENGRLDGALVLGTKEIAYKGLLHKKLGLTIEKYLLEKCGRKITVSIANDTTCLLLSGLTKVAGDNLAAGIIGTGLNFAFFLDKNTLINTESGNFNKFPQSLGSKLIDSDSMIQGQFLFEKDIAGAYLYKQFNALAKKQNISITPLTKTKELSLIAEDDHSPLGDIARELLKQSAVLASCAIAGITNFKKADMTFVMEGSLFWKGYHYKETVQHTVEKLTPYQVNFIDIDNSDILGAAKLVA